MCKDQERSLELPEDPVKQEPEYNKYESEEWLEFERKTLEELNEALRDIARHPL